MEAPSQAPIFAPFHRGHTSETATNCGESNDLFYQNCESEEEKSGHSLIGHEEINGESPKVVVHSPSVDNNKVCSRGVTYCPLKHDKFLDGLRIIGLKWYRMRLSKIFPSLQYESVTQSSHVGLQPT